MIENIEKRIIDALNSKEPEEIKKILNEMTTNLKEIDFSNFEKSFLEANMPIENKISFLLLAHRFREDEHVSFYYELLPDIMNQLTNQSNEEIVTLLSENIEIQQMMADYYRQFPRDLIRYF